jgi:hypothetical protein
MLDARAGTPPTAAELLRRHAEAGHLEGVGELLKDWEHWAADLMESHLSYPVLCYYRSQHDNQSWLASLSAILDTCSLVIVGVDKIDPFQARLTFAIARHALVDLCQTLAVRPEVAEPLEERERDELRRWLTEAGVTMSGGSEADRKLDELRELYRPYAQPLSRLLRMPLPSMLPPPKARYNWETTAWAKTAPDEAH